MANNGSTTKEAGTDFMRKTILLILVLTFVNVVFANIYTGTLNGNVNGPSSYATNAGVANTVSSTNFNDQLARSNTNAPNLSVGYSTTATNAWVLKGGGYVDTNPAVYGSSGKKIYFNSYPNYPGFDAQANIFNIYGDTTGIQFLGYDGSIQGNFKGDNFKIKSGGNIPIVVDNHLDMRQMEPVPILLYSDWFEVETNHTESWTTNKIYWMYTNGLYAAGYNYFEIDDGWMATARIGGHLVPDPAKFPHGITNITAFAHSLGIKVIIYDVGGLTTCAGFPGSTANYVQQDVVDFMLWGLDGIFVDGCVGRPEVSGSMFSTAILNAGNQVGQYGLGITLSNNPSMLLMGSVNYVGYGTSTLVKDARSQSLNFNSSVLGVPFFGDQYTVEAVATSGKVLLEDTSERDIGNYFSLHDCIGAVPCGISQLVMTTNAQQAFVTMSAMMPGDVWLTGVTNPINLFPFTNLEVNAAIKNPLCSPGTLISSNTQAMVFTRALGSYPATNVPPTIGTSNLVAFFNFSNVAQNVAVTLPSGNYYNVRDLWFQTNFVGPATGTFSFLVPSNNASLFLLQQVPNTLVGGILLSNDFANGASIYLPGGTNSGSQAIRVGGFLGASTTPGITSDNTTLILVGGGSAGTQFQNKARNLVTGQIYDNGTFQIVGPLIVGVQVVYPHLTNHVYTWTDAP